MNKKINIAVLTDNNLPILKLVEGEKIINDILEVKNISNNFIVFNDVLRNLKEKDLTKLFKNLKEKNIHYLNITSKIEEIIYADYVIIYSSNRIIMEGTLLSVLKEEKMLKRLGFKLPFAFDLSLQLNYYNVLDKVYLDTNTIGDILW